MTPCLAGTCCPRSNSNRCVGRLWEIFIIWSMMNPPHTIRKQSPFLGFLIFSHATQSPLHLAWLNLKIIGHMYRYMVQAESGIILDILHICVFFSLLIAIEAPKPLSKPISSQGASCSLPSLLGFYDSWCETRKDGVPKTKEQHH